MSPAEQLEAVCSLMELGKPCAVACLQAGVPVGTFHLRVKSLPGAAERYARARESMLEVLADEVLSLADDVANAENPVAVAAARLQVDSRKWLLSKLKPKQYGDRLELAGQVDIAVDPGAVLLKRRQERLAAQGQRVLAEGE